MTDSPDPTAGAGPATAAAFADMLPLELMILDHYSHRSQCVLGSLPAILGRDEKDDVRLTDPWISHSHCELLQQGGVLVVRDLDSKNGVFMHGLRVREAEVLPGDCLTLGRTEITLRYRRATSGEDSAAVETAAPSGSPAPAERRPITGGPATEELLY
jgi:pSer/pThr/pTyr-binding forkhead associated (FHA) protein